MHRYKAILLSVAVIILSLQCNNPTEPIKNKDPREYSWTIDTLFYPESIQTRLARIWASSSNDVYCVGTSDDVKGQIWHFDGKQWTSMHIFMGFAYTPNTVFGFSSDNVWIAGQREYDNPNPPPNFIDSSFAMHYDGSTWKRVTTPKGDRINSIWGSSPNDIWFGGFDGTKIFHWDGVSIKRDSIPYYTPENTQVISIYGSALGEVYFLLTAPSWQTYLFMFKQNNWSVIDSSAWFRNNVWVSDKGNIFESGQVGFYKWTGSNWDNLLGWFDGSTIGIAGTSENNIFIVGYGSTTGPGGQYTSLVYHYNGEDFHLYENLKMSDVKFYDAWMNESEVFIVGQTNKFPQKSIILHGK